MRKAFTCIFLLLTAANVFATGFDIKTSSIIQQPGVEVLGHFNKAWYVMGFEKPGNLNKPPMYQIIRYDEGFAYSKSSPMYPSFGEKTMYLQSAIINGKISVFYGRCDKRADENMMLDKREGHSQMAQILRQDYDANTLQPIGDAVVIFDEVNDHFAASGIQIIHSDDRSKTAVLVKCYYKKNAYRVILTDNVNGEKFSKVFSFETLKQYLQFQDVKVSNTGTVYIQTKVREDVITIHTDSKNMGKKNYYFFAINNAGGEPKTLNIDRSAKGENPADEPLMDVLSTGEMILAYSSGTSEKSAVVKGINVAKYDASLNLTGSTSISPDAKLLTMAAEYASKKDGGLPYFQISQLLPLPDGSFSLIGEYQRTMQPSVERHYLVAYRIEGSMAVRNYNFIGKKQVSATVGYALSAQAYNKGNDVFLFYNGDWETDEEHDMNLQCTKLPANGGAPETVKVVHTSNDFFTSLECFYPAGNGKVLFTEVKLVDYESISKEVKLLEVGMR